MFVLLRLLEATLLRHTFVVVRIEAQASFVVEPADEPSTAAAKHDGLGVLVLVVNKLDFAA
jgi:hypothetical protein